MLYSVIRHLFCVMFVTLLKFAQAAIVSTAQGLRSLGGKHSGGLCIIEPLL